jgi:hypothetical protein
LDPKDQKTSEIRGDKVRDQKNESLEVKLLHGVVETPDSVSYNGVRLPKGTGGEQKVPKRNEHYIDDDFTLDLQESLATAFRMHEPIMIEGGSSLGKSTTVRKMAAELGWSMHYINLQGAAETFDLMGQPTTNMDKKAEGDPDFVFADGPVTAAIREAALGHKVVLLIDEYNVASPDVLIRLHEIIDRYEDGDDVVITENNGERIKMIRENLVIVGAANPPSRGNSDYAGRSPLDKAQFRRWVYKKLPDELPAESFQKYVEELFSYLGEEEWIKELADTFMVFHMEAMSMVANREVGVDQPQEISFDMREEPRRVVKFVQEFVNDRYGGNYSAAIQDALEYYYVSKILDDEQRNKLRAKIAEVGVESGKRVGLEAAGEIEPEEVGRFIADKLHGFIEDGTLDPKDALPQLAAISGIEVPMAEHMREEYFMAGNYKALGKAFSGNKTMTDVEYRIFRRLLESGRLAAKFYISIGAVSTGIDISRAGYLDPSKENDPSDMRAQLISLAGADTDEAWRFRPSPEDLINNDEYLKESATGKTLIGCDGSKAWDLRQALAYPIRYGLAMADRAAINLGYSLIGIRLNTTDDHGYRALLDNMDYPFALMISLLGNDTDEAWEIRAKHFDRLTPEEQARSISGLFSEQAMVVRAQMTDPKIYALSLNSEWEVAALKSVGVIFSEPAGS